MGISTSRFGCGFAGSILFVVYVLSANLLFLQGIGLNVETILAC